jgi:hypothetical protein
MSGVDPSRLIDELTADLEPEDAVELAVELARMIDLGLLDLDEDEGRVAIVEPWPAEMVDAKFSRPCSHAVRR